MTATWVKHPTPWITTYRQRHTRVTPYFLDHIGVRPEAPIYQLLMRRFRKDAKRDPGTWVERPLCDNWDEKEADVMDTYRRDRGYRHWHRVRR